jgi:large subunit ribosomal protein L27
MSTKKQGGTAKNLRDSNPKYLGVKRGDGEAVAIGQVIVRQRGSKILAGKNAKMGKDHTIFAMKTGVVNFKTARKRRFDGNVVSRRVANVEVKA